MLFLHIRFLLHIVTWIRYMKGTLDMHNIQIIKEEKVIVLNRVTLITKTKRDGMEVRFDVY